jgi:hypothetical protein
VSPDPIIGLCTQVVLFVTAIVGYFTLRKQNNEQAFSIQDLKDNEVLLAEQAARMGEALERCQQDRKQNREDIAILMRRLTQIERSRLYGRSDPE